MQLTQLLLLLTQLYLSTFALPRIGPRDVPLSLNPQSNLMGPIKALLPVPNTETTVTFTQITDESTSGAKQGESLVCVAQGLAQVYQSITVKGGSAQPHDILLSGTQPQNSDCLSLHDIDPGDGKVLTYGIAAEALQGVMLQLSANSSAAAEFQVWNRKWGYLGWGSIGMGKS
ncbi:MAG: hypothetical protein Q9220_000848 [cf. Caloplaca sp. 1 TL-2023]